MDKTRNSDFTAKTNRVIKYIILLILSQFFGYMFGKRNKKLKDIVKLFGGAII